MVGSLVGAVGGTAPDGGRRPPSRADGLRAAALLPDLVPGRAHGRAVERGSTAAPVRRAGRFFRARGRRRGRASGRDRRRDEGAAGGTDPDRPGAARLYPASDPESLRLGVRNLHENAVQHMEAVRWSGRCAPVERASLCATRGPGFPPTNCPMSRRASSVGAQERDGERSRPRHRRDGVAPERTEPAAPQPPDGPGLEAEILRA